MSGNGAHPEGLVSPLGSEVANGFVARDRTRPQRRDHSSRFAALAVALALISTPTVVHASCVVGKIIALSLCQEDACTDGFKVENLGVPHEGCKTRPVVRDLTDEERANFRDIIQRFEQEAPNGIYQLRTYPSCLRHGWHERCETRPRLRDLTDEERANFRDAMQRVAQEEAPNVIDQLWAYPRCLLHGWQDARCLAEATVARLADTSNAQTLVQYRTEWLAKERQAHRAVTIRSWLPPIIFSLSTLVSLAWPWLLVALKASLRKYVVYMSVAAIPVQVFFFDILESYRHSQYGETIEWPQLALFCESLILLFVPLQFGYLILQKLKPEALHPIKKTANVFFLFSTGTVLGLAILGAMQLLARSSLGTAG